MNASHPSGPLRHDVSVSERLYRLLLLCYPAQFRRAFGLEMSLTFRDCYRAAIRERQDRSLARLWSLVLYDLVKTATFEHAKNCIAHVKRLFGNTPLFMTSQEMETLLMANHFQLHIAQNTDIGRKRDTNEDNLLSFVPDDPRTRDSKGALFVVADGLGGHTKGDVASELAVKTVREVYYQDATQDIAAALKHAVEQANTAIRAVNVASNPQPDEDHAMGTTCIAAVLQNSAVYVANVGDSRAYIVHEGQVRQISLDHSWVAQQVSAGLMTVEEARGHEKSNQIYRCLGISDEVEVDVFTEPVEAGDTLVLCTDGLTGMVTDEEILRTVEQYDPLESVQRLIERANEAGGADNITAIVVRVSSEQPAEVK